MNIGIYGYGNLGKGVELAARQNPDMHVFGVFTRREAASVQTLTGLPVYPAADVLRYQEDIDVMLLCGGSAADLPENTPLMAGCFNVVDSFDTHACIPEHFEKVQARAKEAGTLALISAGWDPGLFSLSRLYASAILPEGHSYTFWGRGISQGHSNAIRRVEGVKNAREYTVPVPSAVEAVRSGVARDFTPRQMHTRECYVVAEEGADTERIAREIKEMPQYFADYDTTVTFVTEEELMRSHAALPHGGAVIRSGVTGLNGENRHTVEYSLQLDSNPEFTGSALVAFARAVKRMNDRGRTGCISVFDIAPADLSVLTPEELRKQML